MSDNFHKKIKTHGDPEKQIGTTPDGKPIWMDMREMIASPDEDAERWAKTLESRKAAAIDQIAKLVLYNASLFIEETFFNIASNSGKQLLAAGDGQGAFQYAVENGISVIQDGTRTVIKHRGTVIREIVAKIPLNLQEPVAARVNAIVKTLPSKLPA